MKRVFLCLGMLLGMSVALSAQEVGKMWVGGSFSFGSSRSQYENGDNVNNAEYKATNFQFAPELGYQLSENWGMGFSIGYSHQELLTSDNETNGFLMGGFARYSFLKGRIGELFLDGGLEYLYSSFSTNSSNSTADNKTNTFSIGITPGVKIHLMKHVSLIGKLGFLGYSHSKAGDTKQDDFGLSFGDSFTLGVNYNF